MALKRVLSAFAPAGLAGMNVPGYRPPRMGGADGNAVYRVQLGGVLSGLVPASIIWLPPERCVCSSRFQDRQRDDGPTEVAHSAMIGGNMLVVMGTGPKKVAQLLVSSAESSC